MALVKDIQDRVREVAYLMWESAGRQHGMAMEYWLSAEREVITTMQSAAERMMPGQAEGAGEAMADAAPVGQISGAPVEGGEATKAIPAPEAAPAAAAAVAGGEAEPVSQASEAVVEATSATADAAAAAGATAPAAKAAARPTRKASSRAKRTPPPAP